MASPKPGVSTTRKKHNLELYSYFAMLLLSLFFVFHKFYVPVKRNLTPRSSISTVDASSWTVFLIFSAALGTRRSKDL